MTLDPEATLECLTTFAGLVATAVDDSRGFFTFGTFVSGTSSGSDKSVSSAYFLLFDLELRVLKVVIVVSSLFVRVGRKGVFSLRLEKLGDSEELKESLLENGGIPR